MKFTLVNRTDGQIRSFVDFEPKGKVVITSPNRDIRQVKDGSILYLHNSREAVNILRRLRADFMAKLGANFRTRLEVVSYNSDGEVVNRETRQASPADEETEETQETEEEKVFSVSESISVKVGETVTIEMNNLPEGVKIQGRSSDKAIAEYTKGTITGVAEGEAIVKFGYPENMFDIAVTVIS